MDEPKFLPGPHKLIIASIDDAGTEMYYYGYGTMEHVKDVTDNSHGGAHLNPGRTFIDWVPGSVRRQKNYPRDEDFNDRSIGSGRKSLPTNQGQIET